MKKLIATLILSSLGVLWAQGPDIEAEVLNAKKTFRKGKTNKVIITDFTVSFATYNSQAKKAGSGSNVAVNVWLKDYDVKEMQDLTDAIYEKYMEDLRANGFELVDATALKGTRTGKKLSLVPGGGEPVPVKIKDKKKGIFTDYLIFTPRGLTYVSDARQKGGKTDVRKSLKVYQACMALDAMAVNASFKLDFIDFNSKGGLFAQNASVSARPAMTGFDMNTMVFAYTVNYVTGLINVFLKRPYASEMDLTGNMLETKSNEFFGSAFANYDFTPDNYQEAANQYLTTVETAILTRIVDEWKNAGSKASKKKSKKRGRRK